MKLGGLPPCPSPNPPMYTSMTRLTTYVSLSKVLLNNGEQYRVVLKITVTVVICKILHSYHGTVTILTQ